MEYVEDPLKTYLYIVAGSRRVALQKAADALNTRNVRLLGFGIGSGQQLLADPSRRSLRMEFSLEHLPVRDFTPVGAWLLIVFGVVPVLIARTRKRWAWTAALTLAAVEVIWIAVQMPLLYRASIFSWHISSGSCVPFPLRDSIWRLNSVWNGYVRHSCL
ncbi:hypothetical protein [[Eubacterium] cellulosolvens]